MENEKMSPEEKEQMRIHPLDEISKTIKYDKEKLITLLEKEKQKIDTARMPWMERKISFLHQWDDFVEYKHEVILKNHKYIHIPVTFEKIQTWHSRMFKSIFSMEPMFHMEPLSKVTKNDVEATKMLLQWYLRDEINRGDGMKPVIDELLWDLGTDGWGVLCKRWETEARIMYDLERVNGAQAGEEMREMLGDVKKRGRPPKKLDEYKEVKKIITSFSGIIIESIPHEAMYFPEHIPTAGDLNHPKIVMVEILKDEQDIKTNIEMGFYDRAEGEKTLKEGKGFTDSTKETLMRERKRLSGHDYQSIDNQDQYPLYIVFLREDLDGDNIPEEYVLTVSLKAKTVLRITYLDRICKDLSRPIFKFDLIKRPRSSYSRGFVETLYSLNNEIDEFHNLRRISGYIANVPWGFYRAGSGLEKEKIEVTPGVFYPVDDPQADVRPMQFPNVTGWAMSEEQLAQGYVDRLTSMPGYLQGSVTGAVGPLRSNSGLQSLLKESQAPLDVYIERFHTPFNRLMLSILSDLQSRLPPSISVRVLGDRGGLLYAQDGQVAFIDVTKDQYRGKYKFRLAANDAQYNPEAEKQNALLRTQFLLNPFAIQTGVVSPENIYNIYKNLLNKHGEVDINAYITEPSIIPKPMNLFEEYNAITSGRIPMILMNDDHKSKIEGLIGLMRSEAYMEGKSLGTVSPLADTVMAQVLQTHAAYAQMLESLPAAPNNSGMEVPPSPGARQVGMGPGQGSQEKMPQEGPLQG